MKKATDDQFNSLHGLVTSELIRRVSQADDCSTQDIKAAIDWLHKNNITGVATPGSPLAALLSSLPTIDEEAVDRVIR